MVQVGAGNMGRAWLGALADSPDAELVGLVDIDVPHAEQVAREAGLDLVIGSSVAEVARLSGADAVLDVTVPLAHHAVNTEALFAGYPVLCEKPIAETVAATLSLIAASEVSGLLLMTSQSRRYYPQLDEYARMVGTLGGVGILSTTFAKAPHFGGFREEMEHVLLVDMAIHGFDVARRLLGSEPVAVDAREFNPAWSWYRGDAAAWAQFEFADGARFGYAGSWCSPGFETSWNGDWRASGRNGTAVWDGDGAPRLDLVDGVLPDAPASGGPLSGRPLSGGPLSGGPIEIRGALAEFVEALRTGRTPWGEVHTNVLSLAMVEAAVLSSERRTTVRIADVLEDAYAAALAAETRDDVRAALESWGSASGHLGLAGPPAGEGS
jgi:predicted dehydrogenase